jgi:hypothetical protein
MKEDQLREDQRREALARSREEPGSEETLPPPQAVQAAPRFDEPAPMPRNDEPAPRDEAPRRAEPEQPKVDSKALLESAGLVMIETDRSKAPPPPVAEEPQHLGRPRRERPKSAPAQEEELVQIETKR